MNFKRDDFPSFFGFHASRPRYQERFEEALDLLNSSLAKSSIRNVEMKDLKRSCSDAASEGYKFAILEPFVYAQKFMSLPSSVQELEMSISPISGIHSLPSVKKKLDGFKGEPHECVTALRKWVDEFLPLAKAIETLKPNVVMGRAPSTEPPKPVNPNKDVKTCPCCFRPIAVVASTMAHHGYKRPGNGFQTRSCPGINFKPLELSPAGLVYMSEAHANSIEIVKKALEDAPAIKSFKRTFRKVETVVTQGEPGFDDLMKVHVHGLERDLSYHERDKAMFDERIASWKPDMKHKQAEPDDESPSP